MKYSKQRDLILKIVQTSYDHPTADMVYKKAKQNLPNISLGTVYRNLNLLADNGDIKKIIMPNASDRFDKTLNNHYHFSCNQCHKIYDIDNQDMKDLNVFVEKQSGHKVLSHDVVFLGICRNCK